MKTVFAKEYEKYRGEILSLIANFDKEGDRLEVPARNTIKIFKIDGREFNIKSFKIPNAINKVAYRFFRKSKAERSFYYAGVLQKKGIGTPDPVAFAEETSALAFGKSFYVSRHLPYDLTYRELVIDENYPEHEKILRAFTRFTFEMHEKNILFLDHSPGNTLIQVNNGDYKFFLVDLNRMVFKPLNETERIKNFCRLTPHKKMVRIMAEEYASLIKESPEYVFEKMWFFTDQFQKSFHQKQRLKKRLKFWKK
ncbi:Kdo domain containing protein [Christiangramia fulva]|uniref:Kdo domain containing protein n=1 Tax=Christiangramia fulva TaxID=2126553 RepID=A0A2R3Z6D6_9FLAO|nr:lipopolysaccharide kinase InaA family protein [Christiangramia fulva]AVR45820.1 Kdo domain containing protein [Christiangramia fulva]